MLRGFRTSSSDRPFPQRLRTALPSPPGPGPALAGPPPFLFPPPPGRVGGSRALPRCDPGRGFRGVSVPAGGSPGAAQPGPRRRLPGAGGGSPGLCCRFPPTRRKEEGEEFWRRNSGWRKAKSSSLRNRPRCPRAAPVPGLGGGGTAPEPQPRPRSGTEGEAAASRKTRRRFPTFLLGRVVYVPLSALPRDRFPTGEGCHGGQTVPDRVHRDISDPLMRGALQCPKLFQHFWRRIPNASIPKRKQNCLLGSKRIKLGRNPCLAFNLYLVGFILHFPVMSGEEACDRSPWLHFSCGNHAYEKGSAPAWGLMLLPPETRKPH